MDEIKWIVSNRNGTLKPQKMDYVPTWRTFTKASEEDKERIFNIMRQNLLDHGLMESR